MEPPTVDTGKLRALGLALGRGLNAGDQDELDMLIDEGQDLRALVEDAAREIDARRALTAPITITVHHDQGRGVYWGTVPERPSVGIFKEIKGPEKITREEAIQGAKHSVVGYLAALSLFMEQHEALHPEIDRALFTTRDA